MATVFSSIADNAIAQLATASLNNTTTPITVPVVAGQGVRYGAINATGMFVTIWDKTTYPDPLSDPNTEKAIITAISTDSITMSRPSAVAHTAQVWVGNLWRTAHTSQISTAINTLESAPAGQGRTYDAVVAISGGDYTTLGAALTAGARSIYIRRGTYTETNTTSTVWTGTTPITIVGEDREQTIIQLAAAATGYLNINIAGSYIGNLTVKLGAFALADTSTNGWLNLSGARCIAEKMNVISTGSNYVGTACIVSGDSTAVKSVYFSGGAPSGGNFYAPSSATKLLMDDINIIETRNVSSIFTNGNYTTLSNSYITSSTYSAGYVVVHGGYYTNTIATTIINTTTAVSANQTFVGGGSFASLVASTVISSVNAVLLNYRGAVSGCLIDISSASASQTTVALNTSSDGQSVTGNTIVGGANSSGGVAISTDSICEGNYISGFTKSGAYAISAGYGILGINYIENCSVWYQDPGSGKSATQVQKFSMRPYNASGAFTVDVRQFNGAIINLLANSTLSFTEDTLAAGIRMPMVFDLQVIQDATGSRLLTWPASIHWVGGVTPTLTTTANKRDIFSFRYEPISGFYYGNVVGQNYA